jgi:hypothetical protein
MCQATSIRQRLFTRHVVHMLCGLGLLLPPFSTAVSAQCSTVPWLVLITGEDWSLAAIDHRQSCYFVNEHQSWTYRLRLLVHLLHVKYMGAMMGHD